MLREASPDAQTPETLAAHRLVALTSLCQGNFVETRTHSETALRIDDSAWGRDSKLRFGQDSRVAAICYLAHSNWQLGDLRAAREQMERCLVTATETTHVPTLANAHYFAAMLDLFRGDAEAVLRAAKPAVELSRKHTLSLYLTVGNALLGWAHARLGDRETGVAELRQALADLAEQGNKLWLPLYRGLLAQIESDAEDPERALATIDEALVLADQIGAYWASAFLHRICGEVLLKRDPANTMPAEEAFLNAIAIAQKQKARSFELRAALSLAKLYQSTDRPADAHAVLAPALEGFSPTPEFPEIAEAQTLLAALAETDEVKSATASRQRRLQLQTTYANALIHARGHGARETSAAFAKVQELAAGADDPAERFAAYYGLWVGSLNRCEPAPMQETAAAFLREAEHRPNSPEAGVAHRISGVTCLYFGNYTGAQANIEKALDILDSERDRDLAFRFGQDQVAAAMIYLALVLWPLGDVERARQFADRAAAQAAKSGNAPTLVYVNYHLCLFEAVRGDRQRALPVAETVLDLAGKRSMPIWERAGRFLHGWANWLAGDRQVELAEMHRGVELWRELGQGYHRPYLSMLMAEAEADAGRLDFALTELDDVRAEINSMDQRWSEAELHRIRGEILLKRDPASTAPAEEAFLTAIVVAQEQKARSFGLRAALALAKLYKSINRIADAHAILAPALEGFSPTPEFPEIAQAQALLAMLR
jgi:predicted ATPase